jgi:hypothetical protein
MITMTFGRWSMFIDVLAGLQEIKKPRRAKADKCERCLVRTIIMLFFVCTIKISNSLAFTLSVM